MKKLGLTSKKFISNAIVISVFMKILPFMSVSMRDMQFEKIKTLITEKQKEFIKFFHYYAKNWLKSNFLNVNTWDAKKKK